MQLSPQVNAYVGSADMNKAGFAPEPPNVQRYPLTNVSATNCLQGWVFRQCLCKQSHLPHHAPLHNPPYSKINIGVC